MAEVIRDEMDTDHRYRILRTDRGYLLSQRQRNQFGLIAGPAEWLYQKQETAEKGLALVMLMNAWWTAITHGYSTDDLMRRCELAGKEHERIVKELNDPPKVGSEVRDE